MTTCLGKSCSFGLPRVPFVNCCQFMYLVISLLVFRAGCGIWLYQFLIIAYRFTLKHLICMFELYASIHSPFLPDCGKFILFICCTWYFLFMGNYWYIFRWDYRKFPKYLDTQNICCNHSKLWTMWLYHRVMSPNDADGMANSVDPDQSDLGLHCLPRHICPKN